MTRNYEGLQEICERFKDIYMEEVYKPFPQEPLKQLEEAIEAVFKSWDNDRARIYRDLNDIPHDIGTALISKKWYLVIVVIIVEQVLHSLVIL